MQSILKSFLFGIIGILIVLFIIWNNYSEISSFFSSDSKPEVSVSCVLFKTEISKLESLIQEVNDLKMAKLSEEGFSCTTTSYTLFRDDKNNSPSGSEVWGLYKELTNYNLINSSLPNFMDDFFKQSIGISNCQNIISEIKGWLNNPQMDPSNRLLINAAFE